MQKNIMKWISLSLAVVLSAAVILGCAFSTGHIVDTTAPTVSSTIPADAASGIALNASIIANFDTAMLPSSITAVTFTAAAGSSAIEGAIGYSGKAATFTPKVNLAASTLYTATITTGATDLEGNALAIRKVWSFSTGLSTDLVPPAVVSTLPADLATNVALNSVLSATFSEALLPSTITTVTFTAAGAAPVLGTVTYSGTTASLLPASNLYPGTTYTATVSTGVKDLAGNTLASNKVWSFTTGVSVAVGPARVNLGTAGNFAILAKSAISTIPSSVVTGNIGVSPAAASYMTGFSLIADASNVFSTSTQIVGNAYASDYAVPSPTNMTTAISDMEAAYVDAAGRPGPDYTELYTGDLSGKTLVPGLYKWSTGVMINNDVTLNGGPNDVWVFQISGDLTLANGMRVLLAGGALPKNIFWQTFGVASLGTTSHMEGIVLCQTAITLGTGASVNGRLLAQTAVSLDQSTVTQPAQ